jgi:hypothetical protein
LVSPGSGRALIEIGLGLKASRRFHPPYVAGSNRAGRC